MGSGIAQIFAANDHAVTVYDITNDALEKAKRDITDICVFMGVDATLVASIDFQTDLRQAVESADVVIESAPEKPEVKIQIFAALDEMTSPHALLASNTSVIPISTIARDVRRKNRVMGAHFWNPPYLVPLVEVVEAEFTDSDASARMIELLASVGQEPVRVAKDIPGFIGNRLQHALKREAIALVANGVCDAETVDRVIKLGFGARLGVLGTLEQSDLVGLNLTLDIHRIVMADLDVTPGPHPYLEKLVSDGHLGMKSGAGFYEWTEEKADGVRQRLRTFLSRQVAERRAQTAGVRK